MRSKEARGSYITVVSCHCSLFPNWEFFQPCPKKYWDEKHLKKESMGCTLHVLHVCSGALDSPDAVGRIFPMTETSCTSALSGHVCYSTRPCNHANGQALAVIILLLLRTGSPSNAHVMATFVPHSRHSQVQG